MFLATPESGYISGATLMVDVGSDEAGAYMVEKYRAPASMKSDRALQSFTLEKRIARIVSSGLYVRADERGGQRIKHKTAARPQGRG
jgi:hypothetical protein